MMSVMAGNQNRESQEDERPNQAASPPSIFLPRRELEAFDASLQAP